MPMEEESEEEDSSIDYDVSPTQEEPEEMPLDEPPPLDRTHSFRAVVPEEDVASEEPAVEESMPPTPKPILEKRRSATAVVVVPTVETEKSVSRTNSRHELLKRPSSRSLQRAISERIKLEEAAIQLEAEKLSSPPPRQPSPTSPISTTRKKTSPDSESDADQIVIPRTEPEVTANIIETSIEKCPQVVEPDEPTPMPVEEVRPEPEPVVQIRIEVVEPAIVQPVVEQTIVAEPLVVDPVVEPTVEPVVLPEPVREVTVLESIEPVVLDEVTPTPAPPEEPAPTTAREPYPDAESDAISEELPDITTEAEYKPQVIRTEEIQIHRTFRFSQQPTFLHSIAVTNNPYRTAMWNPNDDSESDEEDAQKGSVKKYAASNRGGFDADDPIYSSGDESVTSTRTGTMLNGAKAHKQSGEGETQSSAASPNSISAHSKDAAMPLKPQASYSQLSRLDSDLQPTLRHRKEKKLNGLDYSYLDDLESIQDEVEDEKEILTSDPLKPMKCKRLDEDAERALYGERLVSALGEGIAFTPEAEAAMQQKWQQFFNDSESKMFAAMRNDLEKKQMEQREAEERQKRLRKKWQEQRDQDLQRLQNSRHNSILMSSANTNSATGAVDASLRLRRIRRESCRQLTEELEFGVSVQRDLKETKDMEFFHFYYLPEGHGSIITLKMHALRGDAEVFMSTDTKVPCSSDFMWRSYERMAKTAGEGHRIILYPHDLLRVVTSATANAAPTEHAAAIVESNASTASLRSFYPKQPDATSLKVGFYLSVVALEPGTTFTLAVMSSGQKMQPSRAIQTVDYLIDRFNMLSRSFQGQSVVPFVSSSSVRAMSANGSARSEINDRRILSSGNDSGTIEEEGGDNEENSNENEPTEAATKRRKSKKSVDERGQKELKSFQHLLETLSEKKGFGSPRAASILLAGPSEEHLEFVQDEDQRLQEMHQILSPPKTCPEGSLGHRDSIAVVTERRLTLQGKRQKLRRVVAARLQKKLAPLRHKSIAGGELEKSASTGGLANLRVAKTAPRPVAYSITSLDPLPRSQRFKATGTPLAQVRRSSVIDKGSTNGAELEQKE
ncbi:hypothetical protein PR003_g1731 [Phytophthora rubi]|uniref:Uncharacterized protein n=1 Tax=Phytophthora rubi TaxID=129364 RepID=A0A6A4G3R4_9STRA|nr:hypothetical protein PR003_g1731 [Phytophthora rubi]